MVELQRRESLEDRIAERSAEVAVIGLGCGGLAAAAAFASAGFRVRGLDWEADRVADLRAGRSSAEEVSSAEVTRLVQSGRLRASATSGLGQADVILLCVPIPCTRAKEPDLGLLLRAGEAVRRFLRPGQLVIVESASYPGATEEALMPLLEESGLRCGEQFELACCPERRDPGNREFTIRNTPRVVGGVTARATALAAALYEAVTPRVVRVSCPRTAEMARLMESTFRQVNVALANEMALLCSRMTLDIWEVIDAAATKPFGYMPFYPGPGAGGAAVPVDPHTFAWKAREQAGPARLIDLAVQINDQMPEVVVERAADALNQRGKSLRGSHVLLLGVSYKRDIGDVTGSPAHRVIPRLQRKGAVVIYHDPHVPVLETETGQMVSTPLTPSRLRAADCVLILTDHAALPYEMIIRHAQTVVDTRNALGSARTAKAVKP